MIGLGSKVKISSSRLMTAFLGHAALECQVSPCTPVVHPQVHCTAAGSAFLASQGCTACKYRLGFYNSLEVGYYML